MAIVGDELKMFRSALVSDTPASNGGVMSNNEVISGVNNNIFPDAPEAERVSGSLKYRKTFFKNTNAANLELTNPKVFLDKYTQGDDAVYFFAGTQTDMQSDIPVTPKLYGAGKLDADATAGALTITVLIEAPTRQFFANGDTIRISNRPTVTSAGQEEFLTISAAPTIAGSVVTLTLATPLINSYSAANTRVGNVMAVGASLKPVLSDTNIATAGTGAITFAAIELGNQGTIYDVWTLTFTSSSSFTVEGARTGPIGSGNTLADFTPNNPDSGTPYMRIPSSAWSGAWATGDTVHFTTTPANVPLWNMRAIPPGAQSVSGNKFTIVLSGETA